MNDLINQIQMFINEEIDISTTASENIDSHSEKIKNATKEITAEKGKKERKQEEDLTDLSKKDLDIDKENKGEEKEKEENIPTPDESPSTINLSDAMSFELLIDILNQFRAAHSFTDKKIYNSLKDYFDKLESSEKQVLHVFIKGLIQVTMLNVDGKSAYSPSDLMFAITKTGKASSEKRKSQETAQDASTEAKSPTSKTNRNTPITKIGN